MGYAQFLSCCSAGDFASAPRSHDRFVVCTPILEFPSKMDAFGLGGGNSFGLSLVVELSLRLSYIAQKLEYDIGDQHPSEISTGLGGTTMKF